ncbi:hypothetical protein [Planctomicrobium piriforme]|uniref:Uncharacterized protein n=1 Tax=Planctomicrobium piriforme TaxID=1576369 RepID=A0A1I3R672_9PLAN|nr:hypothetical protein [Planctomicrobium piriforme]SFJ42093.1 hypothetical protein SAMN05421753_12027 [Planctomicrobium piriforme]
MDLRVIRLATALLVVVAVVLMSSRSWAHWYGLGPSKDEWGLKYDGEVDAANGDKLIVHFTIADQGRLKPIHSVFVMAFSNSDRTGTNLVKTSITMQPTDDGKLTGQVEVGKEFADRAVIRIFTLTVDGRSQMAGPTAGARYYDIPLKKFLNKAPLTTSPRSGSSIAPPPASNVAK